MFFWMSASERSFRLSSLPEGSPTLVAAHHHDRLVAGLLEAAQHHDLDQAADVQAGGRGVETDVAGDDPLRGRLVQFGRVGDLVDIAARLQRPEEVGTELRGGGHLTGLSWNRGRAV